MKRNGGVWLAFVLGSLAFVTAARLSGFSNSVGDFGGHIA